MKFTGIISIFALSAFIGYAAETSSAASAAGFTLSDGSKVEVPVTPLSPDPMLVKGKLDNGLTYYIRPNAEPKDRVSIRLRIATGSLNEVEENQGIAHFIEHLVFNGSRHFKRGELMPTMQRHGLGLGGDANAYTSFDETVYMMDLPNLEDKTIDLAFTIMRDFGDGALLEESAIDAERGIIESEYKARDSAQYRVMKEMFGFLLPGTKIPFRMPIGTLDFIRNGQRDLFLDYYHTQYIPSRMQLIVVGDVTVGQTKAWIDKYFGDMQAKPYDFKPEWGKLEAAGKQNAKWIYNKELPSTSVTAACVKPFEMKPDTAAQRLEDFPLVAAVGMLNMRFQRMTEKPDCPFVGARLSQDDIFHMAQLISFDVTANGDQWKEAMTAVEQEIRKAVKFGFNKSEIDEISKAILNSAEVSVKGWDTMKSSAIAMELVRNHADETVFTAPDTDLELVKKGLELIARHPELCRLALEKEWKPETAQISVASNVENKAGEKEILEAFKASLETPIEAPVEEALKPFAYDKVGEPGKIVSTTEVKDMDITQLVLSNGVRVNLKQTGFDKDSINIRMAIDGGEVCRPADKVGLARLASAVMNGGGLEEHSDEELTRLMAGKTVSLSFGVDDERFIVQGSTNRQDLELQLKLLAAQIMHPGYRSEAEMKFRRTLPVMYNSLKHEPYGALAQNGMKFLMNGDKRFLFPSREELESLSTDDVREWVDGPLKSGYLEVSIVGDFDKKEILPIIEQTLASLPARAEKPKALDYEKMAVQLAKSGESADFEYPSAIDRTLVCMVWKSGDGFDRERARRVALLEAVLRERLFKGIREKLGEAYSPRVSSDLSRTYPNMGFLMGISAGVLGNKDKVINAINEIAGALGKGTIDQDELDRAKGPLLNAFDRDLRDNGYWLNIMTNSQADPSDLEMAKTRTEAFKKMSLEEINKLAEEIFKPENTVNLNILPDIKEAGEEKQPEEPVLEEAA